jgi:hypothetical protein
LPIRTGLWFTALLVNVALFSLVCYFGRDISHSLGRSLGAKILMDIIIIAPAAGALFCGAAALFGKRK